MYNVIFFTNILRILRERGMNRQDLHRLSGVSGSFLSDLTRGTGNPSLETMERIAKALQVPLTFLLQRTDLDNEALSSWAEESQQTLLPEGYEWVLAVLPEHQAFQVRKWAEIARSKLNNQFAEEFSR